MASKTFLLFVGCFAISSGLPSNFQCARYCKEEKNTFGYEIGKTYTYNYVGDIRSLVNSTKNDESGVKFMAQVNIQVLSTCDFAMKLSKILMKDYKTVNGEQFTNEMHEGFNEFKTQLEANHLHFSFQNGKIDTICLSDEVKEILDVKRAILSVFQNSMPDLRKDTLVYETDITGNCETSYKVIDNSKGTGTVIQKTKNLDACTHRMAQYLSWQTVPYFSNAKSKSLPLLRSTLSCTQKYTIDNILDASICDEKHAFQPFSQGDNAVLTVVKQQMNLKSIHKSKTIARVPKTMSRSTLIYESDSNRAIKIDPSKTMELLKDLELKTADGVEADVPKIFSELVHHFQNLNKDQLMNIYENINENQRKFYIDSISLITTTSGIEVMNALYRNDKINTKQMDSWIISLSFIKSPNLDTIIAAKPLLEIYSSKENTMLAVSSLIYRYCKQDNNCIEKTPVLEALKEIELPLKNNCVPTGVEKTNAILLSLKSLGNAGVTTSLNTLQNCYSNTDSPIQLRLAAIAAHRRMSCAQNVNLDDFKNYFASSRENTEIRIASYLATIQCASYAVIAQVKDVLMHEETNQVGSFVWTHLTNLQETSVPWKQGLKRLLENEFLKNKFNTDVKKYSRNYEASTFFDSVGAGVAVESNVIFTSESYLPRSAMLNFTLDLFGETINIFEVGGRVEGFEEIVENLFGPEGYFSDKSIRGFLENARNTHGKVEDRVMELGENFNSQKVLQKEPSGLVYAKMFGNEISYSHFNNLNKWFGDPISTKQAIDILLGMFRENDIDFKKSMLFLDSSYKIPTVLGFPLELVANGTATIGLTVKGKLDLKDLWSYKMAVEGKIYPSASIQVTGAMSVNAILTKTGVQYVGNMNSNSYIDGHAFINSGKIVDLRINVPKQQMDVVNVTSDVFIIHNEEAFKIQDASDNIEDERSCSQKLFSKITGFEVCYHMKYVNASQVQTAPHFPLTGSFRYSLNLKKTDQFDSYQLYLKTQNEQENGKPIYAMSLYLDTPNSKINRKIKASYRLDLNKLSLNANLQSPFTNFEMNSNVGNEVNKYSFQLQTLYNNKEIISMQSSFKVNRIGEGLKYEPLAKVNYQEKQIAAVSGSVSYLHMGQYSADLKLEGVTEEPIVIAGDIIYGNNVLNIRTNINSNVLSGEMQAQFQKKENELTTTANLNYSTGGKDEYMSFMWHMNKARKVPLLEDSMLLRFESSQVPNYNIFLQLHNQRSKWFLKNYGKLTFFGTTWSLDQLIKLHKEGNYPDIDLHAYLTCKEKNIDYRIAVIYNVSKSDMNMHVLAQLNLAQRVEALVKYNHKDPVETMHVLLYYPKQTWNFDGKLKRDSLTDYYFDLYGRRNLKGAEQNIMTIIGYYQNSSVIDMRDHWMNCTLDLHDANSYFATPWVITGRFKKSKDMFLIFSQLHTNKDIYFTNVNWVEDTFSFSVGNNRKTLIAINGVQNKTLLSIMLALNIYQHFELNAKLLLPFEQLDLQFYWDKDRDLSRKFVFQAEKNAHKGLYNMIIEYPSQRVIAEFVLLPTQVTMNVTWGIKVSQKIYLKVGNKLYDVGGIWFGELETPFQYLEKQQFELKYYVFTDTFEMQSDISWRTHSINLLVAGLKSTDHVKGFLQLNTTLPEISKVGAALSHTHQSNDNYKTDATFVYNDHQINALSNWKLEGLNIDSNFKVESSSDLIYPIAGTLNVNCSSTTSLMLELGWQKKVISVFSTFKTDASKIRISTPFEGFQQTIFEYAVKSNADSVSLLVTIDLLEQYNHLKFDWSHLDDSMVFWMDITSPVTGYYSLNFTHSTVLGVLKETFAIRGHEYRDIVLLKLEGNIMPILEMKVIASLKLLEHKASLSINNEPDPIFSTMKAEWNDFNIITNYSLIFDVDKIKNFDCSIKSSVLLEDINLKYYHEDGKYVTSMKLPKNYSISNILVFDLNYAENNFTLETTDMAALVQYKHTSQLPSFFQKLKIKIDNHEFKYSLLCSYNDYNNYKLNLEIPYNLNQTQVGNNIILSSKLKLSLKDGSGFITVTKSGQNLANIVGTFDLTKTKRIAKIEFKKGKESVFVMHFEFINDERSIEASIISITVGSYFPKYVNFKAVGGYHIGRSDNRKVFVNVTTSDDYYNLAGNWAPDKSFKADLSLLKNSVTVMSGAINFEAHKTIRLNYVQNVFGVSKSVELNCTVDGGGSIDGRLFIDSDAGCEGDIRFIFNNASCKKSLLVESFLFNHKTLINSSYFVNFKDYNYANLESSLRVLHELIDKDVIVIDIAIDRLHGEITRDDTSGKLDLGFKSNLPKLNNIQLQSEYSIDVKGFEASIDFSYDTDIYKINFANVVLPNIFELSTKITTPQLGVIKLETNTLKENHEYTTQVILYVNDKLYSADIITLFKNSQEWDVKFQINIANLRYSGELDINIKENEQKIELTLAYSQDVNLILLQFRNANLIGHIDGKVQLDCIGLEQQTLGINYDFQQDKKTFLINYNNEELKYAVKGEITRERLNVRVDKGDMPDIIVMGGTHRLYSLRDFSLSYGIVYENRRWKIDILNKFADTYQTKFDVLTPIRDWSRLLLESKLDKDKIRISGNVRNYRTSLIAKKFSPAGDDLLSVNFQGESVLSIWAGAGQMTITTNTNGVFGKYRLVIQCTPMPGIYALSILKNGENLISIMLQNFTNENYVQFRGKLLAPELLPNHSNLSMHFFAYHDVSQSLQFSIHNELKKLFDVKWASNRLPQRYIGYFKFHSQLRALQTFEIHPSLNMTSDFIFNTNITITAYDNKKDVHATVILPVKNSELEMLLLYPCEEHGNCKIFLHLQPKYVSFFWSSPFENWRNISLLTDLQFKETGAFKMCKNNKHFNLEWGYQFKEDSLSWNVSTENSLINLYMFSNKQLSVDAMYVFYKSLKIDTALNGQMMYFNSAIDYTSASKYLKVTLLSNDINFLITGNLVPNDDANFIMKLNNKEIITISKHRINNKPHSQFVKVHLNNPIIALDSHLYYDLTDNKKFQLGLYCNSSIFDEKLINVTAEFASNFENGKADFTLDAITSKLDWFTNFAVDTVTIKANFVHQAHITSININHAIEDTSVKSSVLMNCGGHGMEFIFTGSKQSPEEMECHIILRTPHPAFKEVTANVVLKHNTNYYYIHNLITWPNDQLIALQAIADLKRERKLFDFMFDSTLSLPVKSKLIFKNLNPGIDLVYELVATGEFISLNTTFLPGATLNGNLTSSFDGFKSCKLITHFNKEDKSIDIKLAKEDLEFKMNGEVTDKNGGDYEVDMKLVHPNGDENSAKAYLSMTDNNFNATFHFTNDAVVINVGLDNNIYNIDMKTPYYFAKDVSLKGVYYNDVDIRSLETAGNWNEMEVDFKGVLNLEPKLIDFNMFGNIGADYRGEMNFTYASKGGRRLMEFVGYFPEAKYNTYLKFESGDSQATIMLKTPFNVINSFNIQTTFKKYEHLNVVIIGTTMERSFAFQNSINMTSTSFDALLNLSLPDVNKKWDIILNANKEVGSLQLHHETSDDFNEITLNYVNVNSKFSSNFYINSTNYNANHSFALLYRISPHIEYGLIFNDCQLLEIIKTNNGYFIVELVAKIPYFQIENASLNFTKVRSEKFNFNATYNSYYITVDSFKANKITKANLRYYLPNFYLLGKIDLATTLTQTDNGFNMNYVFSCLDNDNIYGSIRYVNNESIFNVIYTGNTGTEEQKTEGAIYISKRLDKINLYLSKLIKLDIENGDKSRFYCNIQHPRENHTLEIVMSKYAILIKLDTPAIDKNHAELILNYFIDSKYKQFIIYYKQADTRLYQANLVFEQTEPEKYSIKGDLFKLEHQLLDLDAVVNNNYINVMLDLNVLDDKHSARFELNMEHPYLIKLELNSPTLEHQTFIIRTEITNLQTAVFYIASGDKQLGHYISFESYFHAKHIKMEMTSPKFKPLKIFNLNTHWDFETNNTSHILMNLNSDIIGEIMVKTDFILLRELLDIETHLKMPFLEGFETFDGKIYIPKEFRPKIELILPNNQTYSLNFDHNINYDVAYVRAGYQCAEQKFDFVFDLSMVKYEFALFAVIPYDNFQYLSVIIKNPHFELDLNHRKYYLDYKFTNTYESKIAAVVLSTSFVGFEEYSLHVEYTIQPEKVVRFYVYSPALKKKIGVNFELAFSSLMEFKMIYEISSPYVISGYDFIKLYIINELNLNNKTVFIFNCQASTNGYDLVLNMGGIDIDDYKKFSITAQYNDQKLYTQIKLIGSSLYQKVIALDIETSLSTLKNLQLNLKTSTDFEEMRYSNDFLLKFNDLDVINGYIKIANAQITILADNMWHPISLDYKYNLGKTIDILVKLCWNLRKPKESQTGFYLSFDKIISTGLYLPNNSYNLDIEYNKNHTHNLFLFKLELNDKAVIIRESLANITTSEAIYLNSDSLLQLPFRKFQILNEFKADLQSRSINSTTQFIWGKESESKLMLENEILPGKLSSRLSTPALLHDLLFQIDMSKFGAVPSQFKAEFQYSDDPLKLMQFEMYYDKTQAEHFSSQRNFIIKHPASRIFYELYFNAYRRFDYSHGSLELKYMNYESDRLEAIKTSIKVDHDKFGLLGLVETNRNRFNFKTESISGVENLGFLIRTKVNDKDALQLECDYNFKQTSPSLNFAASYGESRKYNFYAGLPNEKEITAKTWNELYGKQSLDTLLTMRLNTSQLLWVKLLWKNELYSQFHKAIFEEYNDLRFVIEATGKELIDVIDDDIGKEFITDMSDIKQRINTYTKEQKKNVFKDFENNKFTILHYISKISTHPSVIEFAKKVVTPLEDYFKLVYATFETACTDILTSLQYAGDMISLQFEIAFEDIKNIRNIKINAKDILKKGINDARKSLKEMESIAIKLLDDFDKYVSNFKAEIEQFFEPFLNLLDDLVVYTEQRLTLLQMAILNVLDNVQQYIYNLRETKEMFLLYSSYINWLEELHVTDVLEPVGDVMEEILESIITDVKKVIEHYKPYLDAISEAIFGKYDGISQLPPITELRENVNRFYQKTIWIWNYHNMTEGLKTAIYKLSSDIDRVFLFIDIDDRSNDFDLPFEHNNYIFRPEIGLIEISQPLPVEWEAFNKPPSFQEHPLYQKIQKKTDQFVKFYKNRYDVIDNIEVLFNIFSESTVSPPTHNFAMVIGKSHYSTFNNGYYSFLSNCSYVLASDFKTNSFSLMVNYKVDNGTTYRTFEILSNDVSIEIDGDKVYLNKKISDLPIIYDHITVFREHDSIVLDSTKGVKMVCNVRFNFCSFELSGWLFGKTGGLLGTLDNEKVTDTVSSNGTQSENIMDFVDSWKIQESCSVTQKVNIKPTTAAGLVNVLMDNICKMFFINENSPLYECFDVIDPTPFLEICIDDMKDSTKPTICSAISAYRSRCKINNVMLALPELCVQCEGDLSSEEKIFDGHNTKSLDVVFITELDCFSSNLSLPKILNSKLNKAGFHHVRYASVGFGGRTLTKPHVYTMNGGNIWSSSNDMDIKYSHGYDRWNAQQYKSVDAIKYASNLDFRAGISKLFILMHCESTTNMENSPEIYNMLGEKDVTLHVLKMKPFGNYTYVGINANNFVVPSLNSREAIKNEKIMDTISDEYSGLALSTNGTVFDFDGCSLPTLWSDFVADTATRSPCQKCRCVPDFDGVGKVECSRCMNPTVKNFLNEYESNKKMQFGDSITS